MLLDIIIPTYNHPNYIDGILAKMSDYMRDHSDFRVIIYDSSTDDCTEAIVSNYESDRVIYKRCDYTVGVDSKTIMALKSGDADYSFLCGDGYTPNVANLLKIISDANDQYDLICIYDSKAPILHKYISNLSQYEFDNKEEFFKYHYWQLTLYGGSLCKRSVIESFDYDYLVEKFAGKGFIYPSALAIYSKGPFLAVEADVLDANDSNRLPGWITNKSAIKTWTKNYYESVTALDNVFNSDTINYILTTSNKNCERLTSRGLLYFRLNDNYNLKILRQYKIYFKKCKACSMFSAYLIALTPKWLLRGVQKIYKILRRR